jgi:hypothetical protein
MVTRHFFRRIAPFAFFLILAAWIAAKVAYSFPDEFPALHLLCKWDCGWYESIARQGYLSPIPPLFQDSEHSNVAFFPAYPLLGRAVAFIFQIPLVAALPLGSILCAILVSVAIARLLADETRGSRILRYAILVAYPASFYLFVSYSESLYLSAMLGGTAILLAYAKKSDVLERNTRMKRAAEFLLLALAGVSIGATRLTGFVIPSFLALGALLFAWRNRNPEAPREGALLSLFRAPFSRRAALFLGAAGAGSAAFFTFCYFQFGVWNLYFWQVAIGWYKEFSPYKALLLLVHHPFGPSLDYAVLTGETRHLSWMLITTLFFVSIYACVRAWATGRRAIREADRATVLRCALVFAAFAHFFIVVSGDVGAWDMWGNGLRYPMPTAYLLTLAWRDEWTPAFIRERPIIRRIVLAAITMVLVGLFALQVAYLGRFIRNEWVS